MGMAASQSRLLQLTGRSNSVRLQLTNLSLQKMSFSREMRNVTNEYQKELNSKTLKWTTNAGVDYSDLSYSKLMYPMGSANQDKLYMITDLRGRVVVDDKYKELAELISPDGSPGDWDTHRAEILSRLTGLSEADINSAEDAYIDFLNSQNELDNLLTREPSRDNFTKHNTQKLLVKLDNDWADKYKNNTKIEAGEIPNIMETLKNELSGYFLEDSDKFEEACDKAAETATQTTMSELIDYLVGIYKGLGGACYQNENGKTSFVWYDVDSDNYTKYQEKHQKWETDKTNAENARDAALETYDRIYNSDVKTKIEFYSTLFSSIAENGWTYNSQIDNDEYLNNSLQNLMFNITNVERTLYQNDYNTYYYENTYSTDIALNCNNIVQVRDAEANEAALIRYEQKKRDIEEKESRVDTRMEKLKTEQTAIQKMIETCQNVLKNNMETHMKIFTG